MKVTINENVQIFNDIAELIDQLEQTYGDVIQEKPIVIQINDEQFSESDFDKFLLFLMSPNRQSLFRVAVDESLVKASVYNPVFTDLFLHQQRNAFKNNGMIQGNQPECSQSLEALLRKAKVDLVLNRSKGLQIQQQQQQQQKQQQQQQQQQVTTQTKKRKHRTPTQPLEFGLNPVLHDSASLGLLIDKDNIHQHMRVFAAELYPAGPLVRLEQIWEDLVGKRVEKIADYRQKITHVQSAAMEQIIRFYPAFSYGLVFDNLPRGFYLQETADNKHVLCYSDQPEFQHDETITPLTIKLNPPKKEPDLGTHRQFIIALLQNHQPQADSRSIKTALSGKNKAFQTAFPNSKNYERRFRELTHKKTLPSDRLAAFHFFIKELTPDNQVANQISELLPNFNFNKEQYQGLVTVLIQTGDQGILQFLQQLDVLRMQGLYSEFSSIFLKEALQFQQFSSASSIERLKKLSTLTGTKQIWWEALVRAHQEAGSPVDFEDLFDAYNYFITELAKTGLNELPVACPFTAIKHMKPALDRALFILKQANDKQEQLNCLRNLDFEPNGAFLASRYHDFQIVTASMQLNTGDQLSGVFVLPETIPVSADLFSARIGHTKDFLAINRFAKLIDRNDPVDGHLYDTMDPKDFVLWTKFGIYKIVFPLGTFYIYYKSGPYTHEPNKYHILQEMPGADGSVQRSYTSVELRAGNPVSNLDYEPPSPQRLFAFMTGLDEEDPSASIVFSRYTGKYHLTFSETEYSEIPWKLTGNVSSWSDRNMLYAVIAYALGGDSQSANIQAETIDFIAAVNAANKAYRAVPGVSPEDSLLYAFYILSRIAPENQPSLSTLTNLMNLISMLPDEEVKMEALKDALVFINSCKEYPTQTTAVFNNFRDRLVKQKDGLTSVKTPLFSFWLRVVSHIDDSLYSYSDQATFFGTNRKMAADFYRLLSCIDTELSTHENREDYQNNALSIAEKLANLGEDIGSELLAILSEIDVNNSYKLPTFEQLGKLIDKVNEQKNDLKQQDEKTRKAWLVEIIVEALPEVSVGHEPQSVSLLNLIQVFKVYLSEINPIKTYDDLIAANLENIVKKMPLGKYIIGGLKESSEKFRNALQAFINAVEKEPVVISQVLAELANIEKIILELLDNYSVLINMAKSMIGDLAGDEAIGLLDSFLEKRALLIFIKTPLETAFKERLNHSVKMLQTRSDNLNNFLLGHLGEIDMTLPIDKALLKYNQEYEQVNRLVNGLIVIKNHDEADYRRVIQLLHQDSTLKLIPFKRMANLIAILNQQPPVASQLEPILAILLSNPNPDPANEAAYKSKLNKALKQVTQLSAKKIVLGAETYHVLLNISFQHNLTQDTLFPLPVMIKLKSIEGIDEEQSDKLFESLVKIIQQMKPEVRSVQVDETISKLTSTIQKLIAKGFSNIVPLTTLLLGCCTESDPNQWRLINDFINNLDDVDDTSMPLLLNILLLGSLNGKTITLEQLIECQTLLKANRDKLILIAELYHYRPYPDLATLSSKLCDGNEAIDSYISAFDLDPKSGRAAGIDRDSGNFKSTEDKIKDQFSTTHIQRVLMDVREIVGDLRLNNQLQFDLAQQLVYINAIGNGGPLKIGNQHCPNLTTISRNTLQEYSKILITQLRQPVINEAEQRQNYLKLLAVMREIHFRSTGKFPYTTQMLCLLLSLDYPNNLLLEINTGEGKSITTAMLAALQWVKDEHCDVITANQNLVSQDFIDKGAVDFFNGLGIPSTSVRFDSPPGTYLTKGINYSTVADLSIYGSGALIRGEPFRGLRANILLDESDYALLDDRTLFNYATASDGDNSNTYHNPYAWVYPLINQFIKQDEFRNLDMTKGEVWVKTQDIQKLKIYLAERASTTLEKQQLLTMTDKKLDKWLNCACNAQRRVEGEHFIIQEEKRYIDGKEKIVHLAIPLIEKNPQYKATLLESEQQFLHARLQSEKPGFHFPIDAEMLCVATQSAKDFIEYYQRHGRILGISGTLGTHEELIEQQSKFGLQAISLPSHQENKREPVKTRLKKSSEAQLASIKKAIDSEIAEDPGNVQPVLIICKDINRVNDLFNKLHGYYAGKNIRVIKITGEETEEERARLNAMAGEKNTIVIGTSMMGRGIDIDPKHKKGLLVIQTYLDTVRTTRQIIGRCARNGKVGRYFAIYDANDLPHQHELSNLMGMNKADRQKALLSLQKELNENNAIERHFLQETSGIQQVILQEFDQWQGFLQQTSLIPAQKELRATLLVLREELISGLTEQWRIQLEASDPKKQYSNPYVRRDEQGKLQPQALDNALSDYIMQANQLWLQMRDQLVSKAKVDSLDELNQQRALYMQEIDIGNQLARQKLAFREEKKALIKEEKNTANRILHALDEDAALLKYSGDALSEEAKKKRQYQSLNTQLNYLATEFNEVLQSLPLKIAEKAVFKIDYQPTSNPHELADHLEVFTQKFDEYNIRFLNQLDIKYRMQPFFIEFMTIFNQSKSSLADGQVMLDPDLIKQVSQLADNYIHQVGAQLACDLTNNLSWAKESNRGLHYFLSRGREKSAAQEILRAAAQLETAHPAQQEECIRQLYRVLQKQRMKLSGLWLFSFWHRNMRQEIDHALTLIDNLAQVADVPATFRETCREESLSDFYKERFAGYLKNASAKLAKKPALAEWEAILKELATIQRSNNSLYVLHELEACLKRHKITSTNAALRPLIQDLLNRLQKDNQEIEEQFGDVLSKSQFLHLKEQQLQLKFNQLENVTAEQVSIKPGHTGFKDYFELVIKGSGTPDLLKDFTRCSPKIDLLEEKKQELLLKKQQLVDECLDVDQLLTVNIPNAKALQNPLPIPVDNRLHARFQQKINHCNRLLSFLQMQEPLADYFDNEDESCLSADVQTKLGEYRELKTLPPFDELTMEKVPMHSANNRETIELIASLKIKNENKQARLAEKIKAWENQLQALQPQAQSSVSEKKSVFSFFKNVAKAMENAFHFQNNRLSFKIDNKTRALKNNENELMELRRIFASLPGKVDQLARDDLRTQLLGELQQLAKALFAAKMSIELVENQIQFIEQALQKEQALSDVALTHFATLDELFDFEAKLTALPQKQVVPLVPVDEIETQEAGNLPIMAM